MLLARKIQIKLAKNYLPILALLLTGALTNCTGAQPASPAGAISIPSPTRIQGTAFPAPGFNGTAVGETPAHPTSTSIKVIVSATPIPGGERWQEAPLLPSIDAAMSKVYELGQSLGNAAHAFSKVGDSETFTSWFLTPFDQEPITYDLGPYQNLQPLIDAFQGSFARQSLAARQGFNAASVFAPLWADPKICLPGETPLACEYRLHRPSYVFILLGTNDFWHKDEFETQMRKIITTSLEMGVIPILGTKADNLEGDGSINATIFSLAQEYKVPLWNFWRAVQGLPENGLDTDGAHLTFGVNEFNNPEAMLRAWPVRNLTALQALDAVWRAIENPPTTP